MNKFFFAFAFLVLAGSVAAVSSSDFAYFRSCSVNTTVGSILTNFTARCVFDSQTPSLAGKIQSDCDDITVWESTNATLLDAEIENATCNTTATVVNFRLPATTASGNDTVWIRYGNSTVTNSQNLAGAWSSYLAVYHFGKDGSDARGTNNLTASGAITYLPSMGNRGYCANLTGQYFKITNGSAVNPTDALTISYMSYQPNDLYHSFGMRDVGTDPNRDWNIYYANDARKRLAFQASASGTGADEIGKEGVSNYIGVYSQVAMVLRSGEVWGYLNGSVIAYKSSAGLGLRSSANNITIGAQYNGAGGYFYGCIDEVRYANANRSADWLKAETYQSYLVAAESAVDSSAPVSTCNSSGAWVGADSIIGLNATDATGVAFLTHAYNGGAWSNATVFTASTEGNKSVVYWAQDTLGYVEVNKTCWVALDKTAPVISFIAPSAVNNSNIAIGNQFFINASLSDASPLQFVNFTFNGTVYNVRDASLVASLDFDNSSAVGDTETTVKDTSFYGNDGVWNGGSSYSLGKFVNAAKFNTSNWVNISSISLNDFSFSFWVKPNSTATSTNVFSYNNRSSGSCTPGISFSLRNMPNTSILLSFLLVLPNCGSSGDSFYSTCVGVNWCKITVTQTTSSFKIYSNNDVIVNGNLGGASFNLSNSNIIIGNNYAGNSAFNGSVDSVSIWNRSLSASEVLQVYRSNLRKYNSTDWVFESNQTGVAMGNYSLSLSANDSLSQFNLQSWDNNVLGDATAPVSSCDSAGTWKKVDQTVTLNATDASGVAFLTHAYAGGAWSNATVFTASTEGNKSVVYWAQDLAGNVEANKTCYVALDKTAPVSTSNGSAGWVGYSVVALNATDGTSGLAFTTHWLNGVPSNLTVFTVLSGNNTIVVSSQDAAGNVETNKTFYHAFDQPWINFVSKTPSDLSTINLFATAMNLTYNVSGNVNQATVKVYYLSNSSISIYNYHINGTSFTGFNNSAYVSNSTLSGDGNYSFTLDENEVYVGSYNYDPELLNPIAKTPFALSSGNDLIKVQLLNVSGIRNYSFFEVYTNFSSTPAPLSWYYCNSSYSTGSPASSVNCALFASQPITLAYNHSHGAYSSHVILPVPVNTSTETINGVKVTNSSYFIGKGAVGTGSWSVNYAPVSTRTGSVQTSVNNGGAWTERAWVVDAHIHQYNTVYGRSFYYYACFNSTSNSTEYCTSVRNDLIQLAGLPPSSPIVFAPINQTIFSGLGANTSVNWTAAVSLNDYPINYYLSRLVFLNGTNVTAYKNNSVSLGSIYNLTGFDNGLYQFEVVAFDNLTQNSTGVSDDFELRNPATQWVTGWVKDLYGNVVSGANVTLNDSASQYWITNATGTFNFTTMVYYDAQHFLISASKNSSWENTSADISMSIGTNTTQNLTFVFANFTVSGYVILHNGTGLDNGWINFTNLNGEWNTSIRTNASGYYSQQLNLTNFTRLFTVMVNNGTKFITNSTSFTATAGSSVTLSDLTLLYNTSVQGYIKLANGTGILSAHLQFQGEWNFTIDTDGDGYYWKDFNLTNESISYQLWANKGGLFTSNTTDRRIVAGVPLEINYTLTENAPGSPGGGGGGFSFAEVVTPTPTPSVEPSQAEAGSDFDALMKYQLLIPVLNWKVANGILLALVLIVFGWLSYERKYDFNPFPRGTLLGVFWALSAWLLITYGGGFSIVV